MAHLAAAAINNWLNLNPTVNIGNQVLPPGQAAAAEAALKSDANGLYYSAYISFLDALRGIQDGYFSWAIVKLYYSAFYSVRSLLGGNVISIFYLTNGSGTPYSIEVVSGGVPRKERGQTHKVVWSILLREFPSLGLHGMIGGIPAHEWMTDLREDTNYRNPRFLDPTVPRCFSALDSNGLERSVAAYVGDTSMLYTFDPDHAAVAFPIECIRFARHALQRGGVAIEPADIAHFESCLEKCGLPPTLLI